MRHLLDIMDFDGKALLEDRIRQRASEATEKSTPTARRLPDAAAELPAAFRIPRGDNVTGPLAKEHALVEKSRKQALASAQVD